MARLEAQMNQERYISLLMCLYVSLSSSVRSSKSVQPAEPEVAAPPPPPVEFVNGKSQELLNPPRSPKLVNDIRSPRTDMAFGVLPGSKIGVKNAFVRK